MAPYGSSQNLEYALNVQMVEAHDDAAVRHLYLNRIGEPGFGDPAHVINHKETTMRLSIRQKLLANEKASRISYIFGEEEDDGREILHQARFLLGSATTPPSCTS